MKYALTLLACLFFFHGQAQNVFKKLIGGWETEAFGGRLHSYWQADGKGGYLGHGIFMEGPDTTYREQLRIFQLNNKWILVAAPEEADPFVFRIKSMNENEVVFENKRFRNPQNVLYRFENDGTFYRRTEGRNEDGSPARNEYFFHKMDGAETAPGFHIPGKKALPHKAELFAPDIISSEAPEFATAISPDGKLLFFNRTSPDRSTIYMMVSHLENGIWSQPENASFSNGKYRDLDPSFTPDGRYLFFSSDRPLNSRNDGDFNIWVVENKTDGLGKPHALTQNVNSTDTEIFTSLTKSGHLYFSRMGKNKRDIIRCELKDKKYQPGEIQNISGAEFKPGNPMVSPDEKYMIFSAEGPNSFGKTDLYICLKNADGTWSDAKNLGGDINSEYADFAPFISADGQYLYFTSERPGTVQDFAEGKRRPGDLYKIYLLGVLEKMKP